MTNNTNNLKLPEPFATTRALRTQARSLSTWDLLQDLVFLSRHPSPMGRSTFAIRLCAVYRAEVLQRISPSHTRTLTPAPTKETKEDENARVRMAIDVWEDTNNQPTQIAVPAPISTIDEQAEAFQADPALKQIFHDWLAGQIIGRPG